MSEALITLIILGVTVVVFIWDRLPVMLVALAVPVAASPSHRAAMHTSAQPAQHVNRC